MPRCGWDGVESRFLEPALELDRPMVQGFSSQRRSSQAYTGTDRGLRGIGSALNAEGTGIRSKGVRVATADTDPKPHAERRFGMPSIA